jgi:C1A family cysteine protease
MHDEMGELGDCECVWQGVFVVGCGYVWLNEHCVTARLGQSARQVWQKDYIKDPLGWVWVVMLKLTLAGG